MSIIIQTSALAQKVPCDIILENSYDKYKGFSYWLVFPKIQIYDLDPIKKYVVNTWQPLAEKLWRFLNKLDEGDEIVFSDNYALRIQTIRKLNELSSDKINYVPISNLLVLSLDFANLSNKERISKSAEVYLNNRINKGAKIITSFSLIVDQKRGTRAAYMNPILGNIDFNSSEIIPPEQVMASFFEIFTNIRVEDNWFINKMFVEEISRGCLDKGQTQCPLLDIGRAIYSHADELSEENGSSAVERVCRYVN